VHKNINIRLLDAESTLCEYVPGSQVVRMGAKFQEEGSGHSRLRDERTHQVNFFDFMS
jgi:hypothetical protein